MILAQKIVRPDGVLLCQAGAELTEGLIRMLDRMNFESIPVQATTGESPEEREARLSEEEAALQDRFSRVMSDPVLVRLYEALSRRIREEY